MKSITRHFISRKKLGAKKVSEVKKKLHRKPVVPHVSSVCTSASSQRVGQAGPQEGSSPSHSKQGLAGADSDLRWRSHGLSEQPLPESGQVPGTKCALVASLQHLLLQAASLHCISVHLPEESSWQFFLPTQLYLHPA